MTLSILNFMNYYELMKTLNYYAWYGLCSIYLFRPIVTSNDNYMLKTC